MVDAGRMNHISSIPLVLQLPALRDRNTTIFNVSIGFQIICAFLVDLALPDVIVVGVCIAALHANSLGHLVV